MVRNEKLVASNGVVSSDPAVAFRAVARLLQLAITATVPCCTTFLISIHAQQCELAHSANIFSSSLSDDKRSNDRH